MKEEEKKRKEKKEKERKKTRIKEKKGGRMQGTAYQSRAVGRC